MVGVLLATACHSTPEQRAGAGAAKPSGEPMKFELVEGKDVDVGGGVKVRLKNILDAHLADSKNHSLLTMDVSRDGKRESVTLQRTSPGEPDFTPVMGLQMSIDHVDAYHQPSTAAILVKSP